MSIAHKLLASLQSASSADVSSGIALVVFAGSFVLFMSLIIILDKLNRRVAALFGLLNTLLLLSCILFPDWGCAVVTSLVHPIASGLASMAASFDFADWSQSTLDTDRVALASLFLATVLYALALSRCMGIFDSRRR